jgi:hypothetical protein
VNVPDSPCVIWPGRITRNGYPRDGATYVHRAALARKLGRPIAPHMDACHTCDVRACVAEGHLYEGTRKQNMADCTARGRHNKPRGERHWRAKLTAEQVQEMRDLTEQGWTRKSLGDLFGVNAATVSRIVRGIWRTEVAA